MFDTENIKPGQLSGVTLVTDENKVNLLKGAKWTAIGGLLLGPLGALGGALLGSRKRELLYLVTLSDGRQLLCKGASSEYETLLSASIDPAAKAEWQKQVDLEGERQQKMQEASDFLRSLEQEPDVLNCPSCSQPIQNVRALAGKTVACPHCGEQFRMP